MKILFLMKYPTCVPETLKRKFNGQMDACLALGHEVWYLEWDGSKFGLMNRKTGEERAVIKTSGLIPLEKYYHTLYFIDMYRAALKSLSMERFDMVYMRLNPTFPPLGKFARKLKKMGITFVQEIPTYLSDDKKEIRENDGIVRRLGMKISGLLYAGVTKHVDLFTAIGDDTNGTLYGKPAMNIDNGIDVSAIAERDYKPKEDSINVLLLASMCYWHGYDRIIRSLENYKGEEKLIFHFVGNDGDGSLAAWKALAEEKGVLDSVVFHGGVYGEDLDKLIDTMDLGVGSLGLYRKGLISASDMKSREYMSRGLPFIFSGIDPTMKEECPYVMNVSNDDSPLDLDKIKDFALKIRNFSDTADRMRGYAMRNMSWETQFQKVLEKVILLSGEKKK